jgi:hypothetical protein
MVEIQDILSYYKLLRELASLHVLHSGPWKRPKARDFQPTDLLFPYFPCFIMVNNRATSNFNTAI